MQESWIHEVLKSLDSRPNVGRLIELCGENYLTIEKLIPDLQSMEGNYVSERREGKDLFVEIVEHTRYTSLFRMTHQFGNGEFKELEPNVLMKAYNDLKLVEVLELKQCTIPELTLYEAPGLENKWRVNLFVSKWLSFCVFQGHRLSNSDNKKLISAFGN